MSDSAKSPEVVIFDYDSISDYLTAVFRSRKALRSTYSLRNWALKMGMKPTDSGNLSRVTTGQRALSRQLGAKIAQDLQLDGFELAYFELLSIGRSKISAESFERIRSCLRAQSKTPVSPSSN